MGELPRDVYTLEAFERGQIERMMGAREHPKVLVVWPHGDETLGAHVGYHIATKRSDLLNNVDYMCGNPYAAGRLNDEGEHEAVRDTAGFSRPVAGTTTVGTDLNRSFRPGHKPASYEERRAAEILELIKTNRYDYVLDLHTSRSRVDRCFIVSDENLSDPRARHVISASRLGRVVVLPETVPDPNNPEATKPLVTDGLIGNIPNAVSIEYHRPVALSVGVQEVMMIIDSLVSGKPTGLEDSAREVYRVTEFIPKDISLPDEANFVQIEPGRWPVLCSGDYGTDGTKSYSGFLATSREVEFI